MSAGIVSIMLSDSENNRNRKKNFQWTYFWPPRGCFCSFNFSAFLVTSIKSQSVYKNVYKYWKLPFLKRFDSVKEEKHVASISRLHASKTECFVLWFPRIRCSGSPHPSPPRAHTTLLFPLKCPRVERNDNSVLLMHMLQKCLGALIITRPCFDHVMLHIYFTSF